MVPVPHSVSVSRSVPRSRSVSVPHSVPVSRSVPRSRSVSVPHSVPVSVSVSISVSVSAHRRSGPAFPGCLEARPHANTSCEIVSHRHISGVGRSAARES